jgi:hypothetical protein
MTPVKDRKPATQAEIERLPYSNAFSIEPRLISLKTEFVALAA